MRRNEPSLLHRVLFRLRITVCIAFRVWHRRQQNYIPTHIKMEATALSLRTTLHYHRRLVVITPQRMTFSIQTPSRLSPDTTLSMTIHLADWTTSQSHLVHRLASNKRQGHLLEHTRLIWYQIPALTELVIFEKRVALDLPSVIFLILNRYFFIGWIILLVLYITVRTSDVAYPSSPHSPIPLVSSPRHRV